ncbi:MAG: hypothetical protein AAGJ86_07090 [Pseudomonadota bacterium]
MRDDYPIIPPTRGIPWHFFVHLLLLVPLVALADSGETRFTEAQDRWREGRELIAYGVSAPEIQQGIAALEFAVSVGFAPAATDLAYLHLHGLHVRQDTKRAEALFESAVAQENTFAMQRYAMELLFGDRLARDEQRATNLLHRAARLGDPTAHVLLATHLREQGNAAEQRQSALLLDSLDEQARHYGFTALAIQRLFDAPEPDAEAEFDRWLAELPSREHNTLIVSFLSSRALTAPLNLRPALTKALFEVYVDRQDLDMVNGYAWVLATCRHPSLRNGERALQLLTPLEDELQDNGYAMDTLAAAYAAAGQFGQAVNYQRRALELIDSEDPALLDAQTRLERYQAGEAWFE